MRKIKNAERHTKKGGKENGIKRQHILYTCRVC